MFIGGQGFLEKIASVGVYLFVTLFVFSFFSSTDPFETNAWIFFLVYCPLLVGGGLVAVYLVFRFLSPTTAIFLGSAGFIGAFLIAFFRL